MDFYLDYMRELEMSHSPESMLRDLAEQVKTVIAQAPARVALAKGAAMLAVIHDYPNPHAIQTLPSFRDLKESVELLLAAMDADIDLDEHMWEESGSDQDTNGPEGQPQEGLSQCFLDFDGIETWGKARWAAFVVQLTSAIDIAASSPTGLDSMSHLLTEIKSAFGRMSVESQEQALTAADRLVLAIRDEMERMMDAMQDRHQFELMELMGNLEGWDDLPESFAEEPPDIDEIKAFSTSEIRPKLDCSGWKDWGEKDWAAFDQSVADAKTAAAAEPSDPAPAMHIFSEIRQNIGTLALTRRFTMGNVADDLMEAIQKGMAQDLFQLQKKCPAVPVPAGPIPGKQQPQQPVAPTSDKAKGCWKRGRVGRELVELNFDQIYDWNLSQWAALKIEIDKLSAAAELTMDALGQPGRILEDIRAHIGQVPQHYREEIVQMATKLERAISGRAAEALAEIQKSDG